MKGEIKVKKQELLVEGRRGLRTFQGSLWTPKVGGVHDTLLRDTHRLKYSIDLGIMMMYQDLKDNYYWLCKKREINKYVLECVTCAQVKVDHQEPYGGVATAGDS